MCAKPWFDLYIYVKALGVTPWGFVLSFDHSCPLTDLRVVGVSSKSENQSTSLIAYKEAKAISTGWEVFVEATSRCRVYSVLENPQSLPVLNIRLTDFTDASPTLN